MKLIIDVGCNVLKGFEKLSSIEKITDTDRKIFIEANPECWDYLDRVVPDIQNAKLIKKALDIKKRTVELITRSDIKSDVAATILGKTFLDESLSRWWISVSDYNTYSVETTTLGEVLQEEEGINYDEIILKLDAEGIEYDVLQQVIYDCIPINKIFCEFHIHGDFYKQRQNDIINKLNNMNIIFNNRD